MSTCSACSSISRLVPGIIFIVQEAQKKVTEGNPKISLKIEIFRIATTLHRSQFVYGI